MGAASVSFSASGETTLLFPQVNFRSSRGSRGCWAERTRAEKQLVVLVGVLAVLLVACLLGLIFQYRASKSFDYFLGTKLPQEREDPGLSFCVRALRQSSLSEQLAGTFCSSFEQTSVQGSCPFDEGGLLGNSQNMIFGARVGCLPAPLTPGQDSWVSNRMFRCGVRSLGSRQDGHLHPLTAGQDLRCGIRCFSDPLSWSLMSEHRVDHFSSSFTSEWMTGHKMRSLRIR